MGGDTAWELARAGEAAAADFALGQLRAIFGSRVDAARPAERASPDALAAADCRSLAGNLPVPVVG